MPLLPLGPPPPLRKSQAPVAASVEGRLSETHGQRGTRMAVGVEVHLSEAHGLRGTRLAGAWRCASPRRTGGGRVTHRWRKVA